MSMKKASDVCAVIPAYNCHHKLLDTLSSLCRQTIPIDALIVDDGSCPSIAISDEFSRWSHILRFPDNRGIVSALNEGVQWVRSRGYKYILRIDAGDLASPDRAELQSKMLDSKAAIGLVASDVVFTATRSKKSFVHCLPTSDREIKKLLHLHNPIIHASTMIRVDTLDRVGGYRAWPLTEDYDLFLRLGKVSEFSSIAKALTQCEDDEEGLSRKFRTRQQLFRLILQLKAFNPLLVTSYLGVTRTAFSLVVPNRIIALSKHALPRFASRKGS